MHDLLAAKEILNSALAIAKEKGLKKIIGVIIELGQNKYAHGDHEHIEEINPENLEFNLRLFAKNTIAENAEFTVKKSDKPDMVIKEINGE